MQCNSELKIRNFSNQLKIPTIQSKFNFIIVIGAINLLKVHKDKFWQN